MSQDSPGQSTVARRRPNRLANETSPYLLQHAYNPVDWYPWGPEALQRARDLNRPILLSIGYSACHWCHVMERESFEDDQIASLMNQHFVAIKVDREERPDLDEIYMQATLALNGQGGWPMTVFLTPEQEPIFAGTYFPPTDRYGRPGFGTILRKVADFWVKDPDGLRRQAAQLTERLKQSTQTASPMAIGEAELDAAVNDFTQEFDARYGGFGGAPKFPPATSLCFLLRRYDKRQDSHTLTMVRKTLDAMASGGMYDHLAGGFHRYSTDEQWLVPHFEKMLYDNALLTRAYIEASQATGDSNYRRVATEALNYILREMTSAEGGFHSATDADSEGVEGKFFVWTPDQIRQVLEQTGSDAAPEDARRFCAYYDITPAGNWEHTNILHTPRSVAEVADELRITVEDLRQSVERVKPQVYEARRARVAPALDDKILTAWNGLMISALAEGGRVFGILEYREAAERAADFLLRAMVRPDGGLYRAYRAGKAQHHACLDDYAALAEGLLDLYEAGSSEQYLRDAVRLVERLVTDFRDDQHGGFFSTAKDHEKLIVRMREGPDGAVPSGNAIAASVLARLAFHYGREDFQEVATGAIRAFGTQISRYPRAFAKSLIVTELLLERPIELAFVGSPATVTYQALRAEADRRYLPNRIIAHYDPALGISDHPLLQGKELVQGQAALYVCRNFTCQAPITDPATVASALAGQRVPPANGSGRLHGKRLVGYATPAGTGRYAVRFVNDPAAGRAGASGYASFGKTGLTCSRLGFGGYRVSIEEPEHRTALVKALHAGCNVIDTSTNYTDGDSERLIGTVLTDEITTGRLNRDEVIIISKIGYVQGQNLKAAQAREKSGRPYPEMVKYGEGIWHCIHPEFLGDQLALALDRLGIETLDVCLLHNPEYFLSDAHHHSRDLSQTRDEFYRRIEEAFTFFEQQVAAGTLRWYGVSSNTCTADRSDPEATSVSRMREAAHRAASRAGASAHHFTVLQFPMNLFEAGALLTPNTGPDGQQTALEIARTEEIATLANRPLNAIPKRPDRGGNGPMIRLADLPLEPPGEPFEMIRDKVAELEADYRRHIAPHIRTSAEGLSAADYFRWADELTRVRERVLNLEHWEQIEGQMVAPHLNQVLRALSQHLTGELTERWEQWRERYLPQLLALLHTLRREATVKSRQKTAAVAQALDPLLPETRRKESLSRKALWVLASTPGVTCILNGMRTPQYVEDSLAVLRWPSLPNPRPVYESLARLSSL